MYSRLITGSQEANGGVDQAGQGGRSAKISRHRGGTQESSKREQKSLTERGKRPL